MGQGDSEWGWMNTKPQLCRANGTEKSVMLCPAELAQGRPR